MLHRVHARTRTPVAAVWGAVLGAFALGLLALAGPTAINAVFSLPVIGQSLAFAIPLVARWAGGRPWRAGALSLGRLVRVSPSLWCVGRKVC